MKQFSLRLTELLNNSGKMQKEICAEMGITKQKLSRWKTGYTEPSLEDLVALCCYFKVSADFLLGLEDEFGAKIFE